MIRKILSAASAMLFAGLLAYGASLPNVPSTSQFSEPSQIVGTLNALVNQLNGNVGYGPAQIVSFGSSCTNAAAGGTPQVCNGQRGQVSYTGITVAATGTNQALVITNSSILATSTCFVQWTTAFTAGSAVYAGTAVPTAGSLSVTVANGGTTTNAVTTGTLGFNCI